MVKILKKTGLAMTMTIGIMAFGGMSVSAEEIHYGDVVEDLAYVQVGGVDYGCVFSPSTGKAEIYHIVTDQEEVKIPDYLTYYGKNYRVVQVREHYSFDDYVSKGFVRAREKIRKLRAPERAQFFSIEGGKWTQLENLTIPSGVKRLDLGGYLRAKVKVEAGNKKYQSAGSGVYTKGGKVLLNTFGTGKKIQIKKGTKKISSAAFRGNIFVQRIEIPGTVTEIEEQAFKGCRKLTKVYIDSTRKAPEIEDTAFRNTKPGIRFYVKNERVAKDLRDELKETGAKKYKIVVQRH